MKTLLLIIFSAITFATHAQTSIYHPFPDSDAVWNAVYYYGDHVICWDEIHYSYVFGNDTVIASRSYHKIMIPFAINISSVPCGSYVPVGYQGAIRQDTTTEKVYFVEQYSTTEQLLYDFNLHVGDTLKYGISKWAPCAQYPDTVTTIDSILIGNTYRKQFTFSGYMSYYQLIEGIGSTNGLLELPCPSRIEEGLRLNCFQQNGITLYPDSTITCDIISSVNDLSEKNISITLSPNPATNLLTITTTSAQPSQIILFDIASRQLIQQKFNGSVILNIENLAKGVYLYEVRSETGVKQGKVVKE